MRRNIGAKCPKSILEQASRRKTLMFRTNDRAFGHFAFKSRSSAADLKSLTHALQNLVQGLQIESGTRIIDLLVPMTFRSPRKDVAAMSRGLRKVGTRPH